MRDGHVTGVQTCALPISPVQTVLAVDVLAAFVQVLLPLAEKPVVFAALVVFVPFSQRVVAQEIPASLAFVAFLASAVKVLFAFLLFLLLFFYVYLPSSFVIVFVYLCFMVYLYVIADVFYVC